jgi:hypothetical protein
MTLDGKMAAWSSSPVAVPHAANPRTEMAARSRAIPFLIP